jgi:putative ABC transport system permease protein
MQMGNVTLKKGDREVQAFVATAVNFSQFIGVYPDRFEFETVEGSPAEWKNNSIIVGYKVNHPNETETAFAQAGDIINMAYAKTVIPQVEETRNFTVVGTLLKKGTPGITNFDYWIFIPLDTAREIFTSQESDLIFVKVFDPETSEHVADKVEGLFPPYQVSILVPATFISQVDYIIGLIQLFLTSVASISLLVAGIGIMNITSVSVMERTREIGIMKAIGAKSTTILTIFLTETALIGLGGIIDVPTGYGLSYLLSIIVSRFMGGGQEGGGVFQNPETQQNIITPIFSPAWAIGALVFGVVVCILFGLYPARKAAKLDPVKALRYE